jgi:hypothetical protein
LMLLRAWAKVVRGTEGLPIALDKYLSHKHRFFRLVRQRSFAKQPGLRQFDVRFFSALKKKKGAGVSYLYGSSPRLEMAHHGDACIYITESAHLRKIELRITPFNRASDYIRHFRMWELLRKCLRPVLEQRSIDSYNIRYAIHFQRTRELISKRKGISNTLHKRSVLDRQTAALRLALSNRNSESQTWMTCLSRVDVAGQERDTPLATFSLYLRLLRGDPEALTYLEQLPPAEADSLGLSCWMRLRARREHRPGIEEDRLGLTVHAGEDFADLLDGLYQVGVAIDAVKLQAGDGIGHALALKSGFEAAGVRGPEFAMMPIGVAHDSLCWLAEFYEQYGTIYGFGCDTSSIIELIDDSAKLVYGKRLFGSNYTADDFRWVWRQRSMQSADPRGFTDLRRRLLDCSRTEAVELNRENYNPVDSRRRKLDDLVRWAQSALLAEIQKRRIVVEMNPA